MSYEIDPSYNSLDRMDKWDEVTQGAIRKRLGQEIGDDSQYAFLTENEGKILERITDFLIPQEKNEKYIKIAESIDRELNNKKEGVRYGENPWKGEFYKNGIIEFEKEAIKFHNKPFDKIGHQEIDDFILKILREDGGLARGFVRKVLSDSIAVYFSHSKAWNEIGFPGPAYPEGYAYLDCGEKDEWEPTYVGNSKFKARNPK